MMRSLLAEVSHDSWETSASREMMRKLVHTLRKNRTKRVWSPKGRKISND